MLSKKSQWTFQVFFFVYFGWVGIWCQISAVHHENLCKTYILFTFATLYPTYLMDKTSFVAEFQQGHLCPYGNGTVLGDPGTRKTVLWQGLVQVNPCIRFKSLLSSETQLGTLVQEVVCQLNLFNRAAIKKTGQNVLLPRPSWRRAIC